MLIPRSDSSDGVFMWQQSALAACGTEAVDARSMRRHWDHELRSLHETPGVLLMRSVCTFVSFALHAYMTPLHPSPAHRLLRRLSTLVLFCMPGTLLHTTRLLHRFGTSSDIHARRLVRRLSTTANLFAKHLSSASA